MYGVTLPSLHRISSSVGELFKFRETRFHEQERVCRLNHCKERERRNLLVSRVEDDFFSKVIRVFQEKQHTTIKKEKENGTIIRKEFSIFVRKNTNKIKR